MEALICIVIVIGLMEFREFRQHKAQTDLLASLKSTITLVEIQLEESRQARATVQKIVAASEADRETFNRILEACEEARTGTQTILREYELNGTPLGYKRRSVDAIEGL